MPNRILKDSICTSDNLDALTADEEVFWYRLIVQCDDYGRMDARPAILRARCYPLRLQTVSENDVSRWLASLQRAGLVHVYTIDGKPYLQIATWDKHQQVRAKRSKYPPMQASDITCNPVLAVAPVIQSNPIQTNHDAGGGSPLEPEFGQVCDTYHQNIGMLTKIISDKLAEDVKEYGAPWVIDAIGIAVRAEKRDLRYVEGILRRWKQGGLSNGSTPHAEIPAESW
jgi:DnaD/phage-associated family protein